MVKIDARVQQKKDTEANWLANPVVLLDGEQAFVVTGNDTPINFKIGDGTKTFAQLPYFVGYGLNVKAVQPSFVFTGQPAGVFLPDANGTYNGVAVDLTAGLTYLVWDGTALTKIVFPINVLNNLKNATSVIEVGRPIKNLVPGNVDAWNRVYPTVAAANAAIPNNYVDIEEDGAMVSRSLRYGKVVQIGTVTDFEEHHWFGGFEDVNLVPKVDLEPLATKEETQTAVDSIKEYNIDAYQFAWADINDKTAMYIEKDGSTVPLKLKPPPNTLDANSIKDKTITKEKLESSVSGGLAIVTDLPGYKWVLWDGVRYAVAVEDDGTVRIPKLFGSGGSGGDIPDGSITYAKLNSFLKTLKINNGEQCLVIGDSVIANNNIQAKLAELTGMTVSTHAKGGIGFVQMVDGDGAGGFPALTSAQIAGKKYVIIAGGLNERSRALGIRTDMYPTQLTLTARLNYVIQKVNSLAATAGNPTVRIIIVAPHLCGKYAYINYAGNQIFPSAEGGNDKTLEDMVNVIKDLAGSYGYPCLDNYHNSGINQFNWPQLTMNTASGSGTPFPANNDQLHPNALGGIQIARYWAGELNKL